MFSNYKLIFSSYEVHLLKTFCVKLNDLFRESTTIQDISYKSKNVKKIKKTVLSSPHVNKKAREQFETKIHSRTIQYTTSQINDEKFLIILNTILNKSPSNIHLKVEVTSKF
jgi:ribosomal protein S10